MVRLVGLEGFEKAYPNQLSGGMQSRVAIARALSYHPRLLLMDEPFGDLDELTRLRLNIELLRIQAAAGIAVLFVTHSIREAIFLADRVLVLSSSPGSVERVITVQLARPRFLDMQESEAFARAVRELRELLGVVDTRASDEGVDDAT